MVNQKFILPLFGILVFALISCKSQLKDKETIPPQERYDASVVQLKKGEYKKAAENFEQVFFQHPGNAITPQAELMQAYSLYLATEYDKAIDVLEIFIKLYPRHENIAYAYYLKALAHYVQISNILLDQARTRYAKESLEEVIRRFPGTKYAIDAAFKIDLVNDHLAGKEMSIGRYYLKKNNPIAAIKRFQNVIEEYQTTSHTEEALYRLVESNVILGLKEEAGKYTAVLSHNYQNGSWLHNAHNLLK